MGLITKIEKGKENKTERERERERVREKFFT
jgi:hypothetical protein